MELTFEEWLNENGYRQTSEIRENMIIDGETEAAIDATIENLQDEYNDYLESLNE